ncbi:response regulator transcription factor [Clostridium sp. OS1-26]|uniref:response regulator transcription factor n=1 Tax=Clostridium sp. OS1-26 TaxID=3070681 RepID=UPI0027DEC350|nr:response regulator transcription factor [Clostridium sp. OS1-26]WML33366.1 response regulator transcription factor [Clostridium sp. OS1-26]
MKEKILVVEDEANIRSFLVVNLSISDFHVIEASSGEEALKICKTDMPDVAILDIMLPGIDGYELCQKLRERSENMAIIMLTAKGQDMDKIVGLDLGADDYMVKPFNPMELISRIRAILRRVKATSKTKNEDVISIKNLKLNKYSQKLYKDDIELNLTNRESALMIVFMENLDKAFTRDELLNLAWGEDFFGDYKTVDVHVRRLREKIEEDPSNPEFIKTVWGHGYRFTKF